MNAQGALWKLQQIEAGWRHGIITEQNATRHRQLSEAFGATERATRARHPREFRDWDDANKFKAELEALSKQSDEGDYRHIEDTAAGLRTMVEVLRETYRRFTHDTKDWKNFAAKDGETPSAEWPLDPGRPFTLEIRPSRADPIGCCLFPTFSQGQPSIGPDPETFRWAHFPQELPQKYPEMALKGRDTNWQTDSPWVTLKFSIDSEPTLVTGIASGAGATQRP